MTSNDQVNEVDETTSGIDEARAAVRAARAGARRTDTVVANTRARIAETNDVRKSNHFADKLRAIIQGAAA